MLRRLKLSLLRGATVVFLWLIACPGFAALTFNVNALVCGVPNVNIGSIKAELLYGYLDLDENGSKEDVFLETGIFSLSEAVPKLDECYDFRWYQIITEIPDAVRLADTTKFKDTDGNFTVSPSKPFVDPPNGGYKYQAPKGADDDPFYENTDPGEYAYSNFSDKHTEGVESKTDDAPGPRDVYFETFLVAYGGLLPANEFCVLAGFSWNTHVTETNPNDSTTWTVAEVVQIGTPFDLDKLNAALDNSGFTAAYGNDWDALTDCDLCCVPEPSTLTLLAGMGFIGLVTSRKRRHAARGKAA